MLPRGERLKTAEFSEAFAGGRVLRHPLLQVRVLRHTSVLRPKAQPAHNQASKAMQNGPRVAFVVPKKQGKAVVRNRLRRRLREIYRLHPLRIEISLALRDCDLIFVAAVPALAASSAELAEAFTQLLRRASRASHEMQKQNAAHSNVP